MAAQQWVCTYCGKITNSTFRPMPGNCPRKPKDSNGKPKPHSWVKR